MKTVKVSGPEGASPQSARNCRRLTAAVNLGNSFLSRLDLFRLALTSHLVAGTLNWVALWGIHKPKPPRRAQPPLPRPQRPPLLVRFAPKAMGVLCRIAALNEGNAAAFRHLASGGGLQGTVVTWGVPFYNQRDDAPVDANFVAVACGFAHSVGLRADGTVVTWGGTDMDQRNDAPTDSNFVAIACGLKHSVALRADGSVDTWGANSDGQRNDAPTDANFIAISCGDNHSVGIRP